MKTSINICNKGISPGADDKSMWGEFEHDLELSVSDIDSCMLDEEGVEVVNSMFHSKTDKLKYEMRFVPRIINTQHR